MPLHSKGHYFMQNLFIPEKLRVGFQQRSDTYTGKLSYIIYYDLQGNIKRENSWQGWCDSSLGSIELDNTAQRGFIINKDVQRYGHFGSGRSIVRIYDPRDFEFEIGVDNLIAILMHSDVSKRDIAEECVFAWGGNGATLVLLPINSKEYQDAIAYTKRSSTTLDVKDLVPGYYYSKRKEEGALLYMGFYPWMDEAYSYNDGQYKLAYKGKKHIFWDPMANTKYRSPFVAFNPAQLSAQTDEPMDEKFSTILEKLQQSKHWKK